MTSEISRHLLQTDPLPTVAIKLVKRKSLNHTSPTDANPSEITPLLEPLGDGPRSSSPVCGARKVDSVSFDLGLAKLALVVDTISFLCMGLARTGRQFTIFGVVGAFGLGFNPAMQSVTLALYTRRGGTEAGRLFGALSVIQAFAYVPVLICGLQLEHILPTHIVLKFWVRHFTASYMREQSPISLAPSSSSLSSLSSSPSSFYSWSGYLITLKTRTRIRLERPTCRVLRYPTTIEIRMSKLYVAVGLSLHVFYFIFPFLGIKMWLLAPFCYRLRL